MNYDMRKKTGIMIIAWQQIENQMVNSVKERERKSQIIITMPVFCQRIMCILFFSGGGNGCES